MYKLLKTSQKSQARLGILKTAHGDIPTPFFMPLATKAAVKNLTADEVKGLGAEIILANSYHLYLEPGLNVLEKIGGLHKLMNWSGPILTDGGGFQVFSLAKIRKIMPYGVEFSSPIDGSKHVLTPKKVLEIQKIIGSDIAMILDVCPSSKENKSKIKAAVDLTTIWAKEASQEIKKTRKPENNKSRNQLFFGIIQGGLYKDLRLKSLNDLVSLGWDGYAIGGLAVGESPKEMYKVLDYLTPAMPKDKPRYLMGVGTPANIIEAVKRGVDMFDCVIPTREARHGRLYCFPSLPRRGLRGGWPTVGQFLPGLSLGKEGKFYTTINITNARFRSDKTPINNTNLKQYSRAYLHHLFKTKEPLAMRLATLNNLEFYLTLMVEIRQAISRGKL